jgi:hypothetical protein
MFWYSAWLRRRPAVGVIRSRRWHIATFGTAVVGAGTSTLLLSPTIRLDSSPSVPTDPNTVKDPATDIEFPSTLHIPSRFPLPEYTLLGVGVRKVHTRDVLYEPVVVGLTFLEGLILEREGLLSRVLC